MCSILKQPRIREDLRPEDPVDELLFTYPSSTLLAVVDTVMDIFTETSYNFLTLRSRNSKKLTWLFAAIMLLRRPLIILQHKSVWVFCSI